MTTIYVYDNSTNQSKNFVSYVSLIDDTNNNTYKTSYQKYIQVNSYIKTQLENFMNDYNKKKSIDYNRFQDILCMQTTFQKIMVNNLSSLYGDYNVLYKMVNETVEYNNIINSGLDELNGNDGSIAYSQNILLDSTIYSSVLWTILAICLIYYVFIKM